MTRQTAAKLEAVRSDPRPGDVREGARRVLLELAANGRRLSLDDDHERTLRTLLAQGRGFVTVSAALVGEGRGVRTTNDLVGALWRLASLPD